MARESQTATDASLDKELVARTLGQLGEPRNPHRSYDDATEMRFLNVAATRRYDDVHRGLFIDSEDTERLRYGWTNDDRTGWKVDDHGTEIVVTSVDELETPDSDAPVTDEQDYVQEWVEILLSELRHDIESDATNRSVRDIVNFVGSQTLLLDDECGHRAIFEFELVE